MYKISRKDFAEIKEEKDYRKRIMKTSRLNYTEIEKEYKKILKNIIRPQQQLKPRTAYLYFYILPANAERYYHKIIKTLY